jgi:hypothetical protein
MDAWRSVGVDVVDIGRHRWVFLEEDKEGGIGIEESDANGNGPDGC